MECHPHPRQDEHLEEGFLLRGDPMKLYEGLCVLVKDLEMLGQVLVEWEGSEANPGGSESS